MGVAFITLLYTMFICSTVTRVKGLTRTTEMHREIKDYHKNTPKVFFEYFFVYPELGRSDHKWSRCVLDFQ